MNHNIKVAFFDLFFTLITPRYNSLKNEYDVLNITKEQWEEYAEDIKLYTVRATGKEKNPYIIIKNIMKNIGQNENHQACEEILKLREDRFRQSLIEIDPKIISVLQHIKESGIKLCLISNVDIIDVMHWDKSPLKSLFHKVIFSYEVGFLKPNREIYELALEEMEVNSSECIFIGDGGSDELKGAKELGITTVLATHFLRRETSEHEKMKIFADFCIEDFDEIIEILFKDETF
ncbi:hypothetical protein CSC2_03340 [Clostridium zeae]|uniref:HAD family hydrolase n=1 Tax=Clostridium zeae TaxID=2759022 RepID=A0ABQ1E4Z8_9CLOT|nr:HAD-IA family hydrolase [Clostridium zeae]GFZ29808.1 hypothetical protein CSC2_03340 [Clostridium zeae]